MHRAFGAVATISSCSENKVLKHLPAHLPRAASYLNEGAEKIENK